MLFIQYKLNNHTWFWRRVINQHCHKIELKKSLMGDTLYITTAIGSEHKRKVERLIHFLSTGKFA